MKLVIIESPYRGKTTWNTAANIAYARDCMKDSLSRGEAPLASHLLYTQDGVLDDTIPEDRVAGMRCGLAWAQHADLTAVYTDRGISEGMAAGIKDAWEVGRPVEYRYLGRGGFVRKVDAEMMG